MRAGAASSALLRRDTPRRRGPTIAAVFALDHIRTGAVRRILNDIARPCGRGSTRGPPWIWRLKQPAADTRPRRQIEIIWELATWPILPILQTMAGALNPGEFPGLSGSAGQYERRILAPPRLRQCGRRT